MRSGYGSQATLVRIEHVTGEIARALQVDDDTCVLAIDSTVFHDETAVAFGVARHTPANSAISFSMGAA